MSSNGPFHTSPTDSRSPIHFYKLCLLTNRRAGSPAGAPDKGQPVQASSSIHCSSKRVCILCYQKEYRHLAVRSRCLAPKGVATQRYSAHSLLSC